jgi:hypothetical protein
MNINNLKANIALYESRIAQQQLQLQQTAETLSLLKDAYDYHTKKAPRHGNDGERICSQKTKHNHESI